MSPSYLSLISHILLLVSLAGGIFSDYALADDTPAWKTASVIELSKHTVSLSQPVLVARSTGRLWFPSLFNLGDRRLTFPNDKAGTPLLWAAISQSLEFTADTFFALAD